MILESDQADDYCLASGKSYSIEDFLNKVAEKLNMDWHDYIVIDPKYYRPSELNFLQGDYAKIKNKLGWEPTWTLDMIIDEMILEKKKELKLV